MVAQTEQGLNPSALVLIVGLVATAVLTLAHGDAGTSEDIKQRGEWLAIHIAQVLTYFLMAIGAMGLAFGARRDLTRLALAFVALGAILVALAHVLDGPVRVELHEAGLGDGDLLYASLIGFGIWMIVPGYLFMGIGGATQMYAMRDAMVGWTRSVSIVAIVLYVVGAQAGWGSLLLEVIPGVTFLAFVLAWLWTAFCLWRGGSTELADLTVGTPA